MEEKIEKIGKIFFEFAVIIEIILKDIITKQKRLEIKKKKKEAIHILASGPSLNDSIEYVKKIGGKIMMVNGGSMAFGNTLLPDYYCMNDPLYFTEDTDQESKDHLEAHKQYKHKVLYFIPSDYTDFFVEKLKFRNVYGVNCRYSRFVNIFKNRLYQKNLISPRMQTVTNMALYVALQLGYKKIYIHGLDMTWLEDLYVDGDNVVWSKYKHFYENSDIKWSLDYLTSINSLRYAFESFYDLKKYADFVGAEIINMNPNSIVDCFEKYKYSN